jgi:hypothetical protein
MGYNVFQKQSGLIFRPRNAFIRDVLESHGFVEFFREEKKALWLESTAMVVTIILTNKAT